MKKNIWKGLCFAPNVYMDTCRKILFTGADCLVAVVMAFSVFLPGEVASADAAIDICQNILVPPESLFAIQDPQKNIEVKNGVLVELTDGTMVLGVDEFLSSGHGGIEFNIRRLAVNRSRGFKEPLAEDVGLMEFIGMEEASQLKVAKYLWFGEIEVSRSNEDPYRYVISRANESSGTYREMRKRESELEPTLENSVSHLAKFLGVHASHLLAPGVEFIRFEDSPDYTVHLDPVANAIKTELKMKSFGHDLDNKLTAIFAQMKRLKNRLGKEALQDFYVVGSELSQLFERNYAIMVFSGILHLIGPEYQHDIRELLSFSQKIIAKERIPQGNYIDGLDKFDEFSGAYRKLRQMDSTQVDLFVVGPEIK